MKASRQSRELLTSLLRDVSRSFYLTLRVLPQPIRQQIGLAYLLARATDTIADTDLIPVDQRLAALDELRAAILNAPAHSVSLEHLLPHQNDSSERLLLQRINEALGLLAQFDPNDRALIQSVLKTITDGQRLDLLRFANATPIGIVALQSDAELDDYTYKVAGCVGEFWTRICWAHLNPKPKATLDSLVEKGIRFGKGLQLVNILRDLPADLRKGRCYLPEPALKSLGLTPLDLLKSDAEQQARPLINRWLDQAEAHLDAGWSYVLDLPFGWFRVRLGCAWPILIGVKTLEELKRGRILDGNTRIKVSRADVKRIIRKSVLGYFAPGWKELPQTIRSS